MMVVHIILVQAHGILNGKWSVGLIQWCGSRAYDVCYNICHGNGNWQSLFVSDCELKNAIANSIQTGGSGTQRGRFDEGFNPAVGSSQYNSIKNILGASNAKDTQKLLASAETNENLINMMNMGITTPTMLIYLADLINQYGSGIPETLEYAKKICSNGGDMMTQLDKLVEKVKTFATYSLYQARRNTTYSYVKDLYNSGKLNFNIPTDEPTNYAESQTATFISGTGQLSLPFNGSAVIKVTFGESG